MNTAIATRGRIVECTATDGVYERDGHRFMYCVIKPGKFYFGGGQESEDVEVAWRNGYREDIQRGLYRL